MTPTAISPALPDGAMLPYASTVLTVDQGNTAIKLDLWHSGASGEWAHEGHLTVRSEDYDDIFGWVEACSPGGGIYCSVGRMDVRLIESLRCLLGDRLLVLTPSVELPVKVAYATPGTLGPDRAAAACGAAAVMPGQACVIADAGTALTTDLLTADATFAGGRISPGLSLRFRSLHDHTSRLPRLTTEELRPADILSEVPETGYDTRTSILSGVIRGTAAEIASAITPDYPRLLLTGGDAPLLEPVVRQLLTDPQLLTHHPLLMSRGLLSIYLYNEDHLNDDNA